MINSIILEGRVVRQPEIKELNNEQKTKVANFSIAHHKTKEECIFFSIVAYNTVADVAEKLNKGERATIQGRLNSKSWTDKETGANRQSIEIIADLIHFTGGIKNDSNETTPENN